MAAGGSTGMIIVWEWKENDGSWIPYDPISSNKIESTNQSYPHDGNSSVTILVDVPAFNCSFAYLVDVVKKQQCNPHTDRKRDIKRRLLPTTSALGSGFTWEWDKGNVGFTLWTSYSTELVEEIESAFQRSEAEFKFPSRYRLPYRIKFQHFEQENIRTRNRRQIRREHLRNRYELDMNHPVGHLAAGAGNLTLNQNPSSFHSTAPGSYPHGSTSAWQTPGNLTGFSGIPGNPASSLPAYSPGSYSSSSVTYPHRSTSLVQNPGYPAGYAGTPGNNASHSTYPPKQASPTRSPPFQSFFGSATGDPATPISSTATNPHSSHSSASNTSGASLNAAAVNPGNQHLSNADNSSNRFPSFPSDVDIYSSSPPSLTDPQSGPSSSTSQPSSLTSSSTSSNKKSTSQPSSTKKKWRSRPVQWKPCPSGGISCLPAASGSANVPISQVMSLHTNKANVDPSSTDQCVICQYQLTEDSGFGSSKETVELTLCKHVFHRECVETNYSHGVKDGCIVCPSCNKSHGVKTGNQPNGTMTYSSNATRLSGYSGSGTITIVYQISPGTQTADHPHPGRHFRAPGFPRTAYLPNNDEGRSILYLLVEAWKRRLIFTVGRSSTTGQDDVVTWTSIHHKTSTHAAGGHGYPDDTYLERVRDELEAAGVVDNDQ